MAPKEEALGTRTDTAYFVILEERSTFIIGWFDLADLEEIERLPLHVLA